MLVLKMVTKSGRVLAVSVPSNGPILQQTSWASLPEAVKSIAAALFGAAVFLHLDGN